VEAVVAVQYRFRGYSIRHNNDFGLDSIDEDDTND